MEMNKTLGFRAHLGGDTAELQLATNNADKHVNLFVRATGCICAHPDDAKKLRDVLIELYPLPEKPATPKVIYEVGANAKVCRFVPTSTVQRYVVGEFTDRVDAEAFAAMKNAEVQ